MSAVIVGVGSVAPAGIEVPQFGTCVRWIRAARLHGFRVESIATRSRRLAAIAAVIAVAIGVSPRVLIAQADDQSVALVVQAGRPLRVALDERIRLKRVGQPITGTLVEPVYAYDRIVIPVGTRVLGHVDKLENASKGTRVRAILGGDFSPLRRAVLQFDTIVSSDGTRTPIRVVVKSGAANMKRQVAGGPGGDDKGAAKRGVVGRAEREAKQKVADAVTEAKQQAHDALSAIRQPGRMERLEEKMMDRLPYHPQFLRKGTVFSAELSEPLDFGTVNPTARALAGALPAPDSILTARLVNAIDSLKTTRGTPIEAVITEPVFSSDHQLIVPEGARLRGEVTFAQPARRLHRNGQLRFLFESVQLPDENPAKLLASLHSVDVSGDDRVAVDKEGGTRVTNSNARFVAPVLAVLALRASVDQHTEVDDDDFDSATGTALSPVTSVESGSLGVGGKGIGSFIGFGMIGLGLARFSHPVGVALAAVGVARTVYGAVFTKGHDVSFPADTAIQVQIAPGPLPDRQ